MLHSGQFLTIHLKVDIKYSCSQSYLKAPLLQCFYSIHMSNLVLLTRKLKEQTSNQHSHVMIYDISM